MITADERGTWWIDFVTGREPNTISVLYIGNISKLYMVELPKEMCYLGFFLYLGGNLEYIRQYDTLWHGNQTDFPWIISMLCNCCAALVLSALLSLWSSKRVSIGERRADQVRDYCRWERERDGWILSLGGNRTLYQHYIYRNHAIYQSSIWYNRVAGRTVLSGFFYFVMGILSKYNSMTFNDIGNQIDFSCVISILVVLIYVAFVLSALVVSEVQ